MVSSRKINPIEKSSNFVLILLAIEVIDGLTEFPLDAFGIYPLTVSGLVGVVFSPLLHAGFGHLFANIVPLWILLTLIYADSRYQPERTLGLVWVFSGLGTWLIGRPAVHVGASSLVFGLAAYLIVSGILMRSWRAFFVAVLVFLVFGGMFVGVLPQRGPVSWEGHFSGMAAGIWAALKTRQRVARIR